MKFYFPDSQDQIDPTFDFESEERSPLRVRQRDDRYAHEVLSPSPYEGMLLSKAMIDRHGGAGRYSAQQRQRFYRVGVREFFRLDEVNGPRIDTLGDCGAFSYINDPKPPYSPDEVIDFYEQTGFDAGVSVDHVIPIFDGTGQMELIDSPWKDRYDLTMELAEEFLIRHRQRECDFEPIGVAQGWSARSYKNAVSRLQEMGYQRIALGGLVPLKTHEILSLLGAIDEIRHVETQLHLFGVTRTEQVPAFRRYGVTSFDSTSPFRQAFKDATNNYYSLDRTYVALRVPQVEGNAKLQAKIRSGQINQEVARKLERHALSALRRFDNGKADLEEALSAVCEYQELHDSRRDRADEYRETLTVAPWKECDCAVCTDVGIEVALFRGTERNKRRGFHNLHVFAKRLEREIVKSDDELLATI